MKNNFKTLLFIQSTFLLKFGIYSIYMVTVIDDIAVDTKGIVCFKDFDFTNWLSAYRTK